MTIKLRKFKKTGADRVMALYELPLAKYMPDARTHIDPQTIGEVDMHWAAVTHPGARFPALGTEGLASCMGLAVHNTATRATGLAHLAQEGPTLDLAGESRHSLIAMLNQVCAQGGRIQARIVGPTSGGPMVARMVDQVAEVLKEYDVEVMSADFSTKPGTLRQFAVHSGFWEQGLIRGRYSMAELMNASAHGGEKAIEKLQAQAVNLDKMVPLRSPTPESLLYNGLTETTGLEHYPGMD